MLYSLLPLMLQMGVGVSDPAYPDPLAGVPDPVVPRVDPHPFRGIFSWSRSGRHTGHPAEPEKKARRKAQQHARRQQRRYDNRRRK